MGHINPREYKVQEAALELATAVNKLVAKHKLTYAELTDIILEVAMIWNNYGIRAERQLEEPRDSTKG
jgi:NTP pyrophosphatase (non-canonical NTP hydrolase)